MRGEPLDDADQVIRRGDTVSFDFWYPRLDRHARYIEVGLCDVRAADTIRIRYDFARDGYAVEQPKRTQVLVNSTPTMATYEERVEWIEQAFLPAWPFESEGDR